MKALYVVVGPEGGRFRFDEAPMTDPGPGQARVRVCASGLNRGVVMFLAAQRGDGSRVIPMGIVEFAGEVDALGDGVEGVSVGDRVMARGAGRRRRIRQPRCPLPGTRARALVVGTGPPRCPTCSLPATMRW